MLRIKIVVEGQSEEAFINDVLAPTFWPQQIYLYPILLGVPGHKGGRPNYARLKKDLVLHLKQDRNAYCSMMLDYYGLGPGYPCDIPAGTPSAAAVEVIEAAVAADIGATIPEFRPDLRLIRKRPAEAVLKGLLRVWYGKAGKPVVTELVADLT